MRLLEKSSAALSPLCFCSGSCFILFVVALSFQSSLHHRFPMRPNGWRESCSGANWSISARVKPADGSACQAARHWRTGTTTDPHHYTHSAHTHTHTVTTMLTCSVKAQYASLRSLTEHKCLANIRSVGEDRPGVWGWNKHTNTHYVFLKGGIWYVGSTVVSPI